MARRRVAGGLAVLALAGCTTEHRKVPHASATPSATAVSTAPLVDVAKAKPPDATVRLIVPPGTQSVTRTFRVVAEITPSRANSVSGWVYFKMSGLVLDPTVQVRDRRGGWGAPLNGLGASIRPVKVAAGHTRRVTMRVGTGGHAPTRYVEDAERGTIPVRPRTVHLTASFGSLTASVSASADVNVAGVTFGPLPAHTGCDLAGPAHSCDVHLVLVNRADRAAYTGLSVNTQQRRCGSEPECFVYDDWQVWTPQLGWVTPHPDAGLAAFDVARLGKLPPGRTAITVRITRTKPGGDWYGNISMAAVTTSPRTEYYRSCISAVRAGTGEFRRSTICR